MSETSVISTQIDGIIEQRKLRAEELRRKRDDLKDLRNIINSGNLGVRAKAIKDDELRQECEAMLRKASFSMDIKKEIDATLRRLESAVARFERNSINVATVGRARQGKSTFLQAVGNLGNDIIPAFDAGDCTGAVSVIHNDPSVEEGKVRVELLFRSREEIVEIVKAYIECISPEYIQKNTISYEDIGYISISELEGCIENGDAGKTIKLEHLRRIVDDFNGTGDSKSEPIANLCGLSSKILTDPDEIRKFVAQNNGRAADDPYRENYYSYLAVKRADIYCRFSEDVGKLVLVDTIGLGDTQTGIEEAMLDTVDNQCDAAIVVTKPDAGIRTEDENLYNLLRDRFKGRDTSKWLFYLANEQKGYNENAISTFVEQVKEKNFAVAGCIRVNSKDKNSVREDFLAPMLNILLANMAQIDGQYIEQINSMCNALKEKIRGVVNDFPEPQNLNSQTLVGLQVSQLGKACYNRLTSKLANQVDYWYKQRNKPNAVLWNRIKDILDGLESILPEAEKLQEALEDNGSLIGDYIWMTPLNYVRNKITDQFIAIDKPMEEETLSFKNAIVEELYVSLKNLGVKVGSTVSLEKEPKDHVKWLWEVIDPLIRDKPKYSQIHKAFQFLNQFEFNVRAQLIQEVRNQLGIINPMTPELYMRPNYTFSKPNAGEAITFYLNSRLAILEDGLRHSLSKMNRLPNRAFYAAAEEFYDRLTFASDLDNSIFVDMSEIWGDFFTEYSQLLWAEQVDRYKEMDEIMKEYANYLNIIYYKLENMA